MAPVAVAARLDRDQDSQCDGEHADRDQRGDLDRDAMNPTSSTDGGSSATARGHGRLHSSS